MIRFPDSPAWCFLAKIAGEVKLESFWVSHGDTLFLAIYWYVVPDMTLWYTMCPFWSFLFLIFGILNLMIVACRNSMTMITSLWRCQYIIYNFQIKFQQLVMLNLHAWFTFFFSSSNHHTTPWFTWPLDAQETHPNELKRFGFTCCCSENNDEFSVNVDERQRPSTVLPSPGRHTGKPVGFWGDAKRIEIEMLGGSVFVFWPPFKIWSRKFTACKYFLAHFHTEASHVCTRVSL